MQRYVLGARENGFVGWLERAEVELTYMEENRSTVSWLSSLSDRVAFSKRFGDWVTFIIHMLPARWGERSFAHSFAFISPRPRT
jgi:hypothetical protein